MYPVDERILEHLNDTDWATPATMASEIEFDQLDADECTIRERCQLLARRELVAPMFYNTDGDEFEITRWGQAYLRGDVAADMLQSYP